MLALWNYHLPLTFAQICNKDSISALCVYWCIAHQLNDPTFGKTQVSVGILPCGHFHIVDLAETYFRKTTRLRLMFFRMTGKQADD